MGLFARHRSLAGTVVIIILTALSGCKLDNSGESSSHPLTTLLEGRVGTPGASITLSWNAPMMNDDGSPLVDLAGYRIYYGQSPGNYDAVVQIDNVGLMTWVLDGLSPGTYYIIMTSVNSVGAESGPSLEFNRTIG